MKINDPNSARASGLAQSRALTPGGETSGQRASAVRSRPDQVQLSNLSGYLAASESDSPEQAARVSHLTAAVSNGSYLVDVHAVSAKIIQESMRPGVEMYR